MLDVHEMMNNGGMPFFVAITLGAVLLYFIRRRSRQEQKGEPSEKSEPKPAYPKPREGDYTLEELARHNGTDPSVAVLTAVRGQVLDVSSSDNYRVGGAYHMFAGRDVSRALAKMSFEEEDLNGNLEGLTLVQLDTLNDWFHKLSSRYPVIGKVVETGSV